MHSRSTHRRLLAPLSKEQEAATAADESTASPAPRQDLNWSTQETNGGARDPVEDDHKGTRMSPTYRRTKHARGYDVDNAILEIRKQFKFQRFAALRMLRGLTGWDVFVRTNDGERAHLRLDCYGLRQSAHAFYMSNEEKMSCMGMPVCQYCVDNMRDNFDYPAPFDLT